MDITNSNKVISPHIISSFGSFIQFMVKFIEKCEIFVKLNYFLTSSAPKPKIINFIVHFYNLLYFNLINWCSNIFKLFTVESKVEIPPFLFDQPKAVSARIILAEDMEGIISREFGFIIAVVDVLEVGPGIIIPGNANTFHEVTFTILTFKPTVGEIVEGEVVEIVDFGSFCRLGPLDGLVHVSQICDDYISYEQVGNRFIGKETGKILEVHDQVRARIIAVSLGTGKSGKLGLTMRQKFLGKKEWIEADIEEEFAEKQVKAAKSATKENKTESGDIE